MYMYKEDLALNNLQWLICHKTKPNIANIFDKYMLVSIKVPSNYNQICIWTSENIKNCELVGGGEFLYAQRHCVPQYGVGKVLKKSFSFPPHFCLAQSLAHSLEEWVISLPLPNIQIPATNRSHLTFWQSIFCFCQDPGDLQGKNNFRDYLTRWELSYITFSFHLQFNERKHLQTLNHYQWIFASTDLSMTHHSISLEKQKPSKETRSEVKGTCSQVALKAPIPARSLKLSNNETLYHLYGRLIRTAGTIYDQRPMFQPKQSFENSDITMWCSQITEVKPQMAWNVCVCVCVCVCLKNNNDKFFVILRYRSS